MAMCLFNNHRLWWHRNLYIIWLSRINDIKKECFEHLAVKEKNITCYRHCFLSETPQTCQTMGKRCIWCTPGTDFPRRFWEGRKLALSSNLPEPAINLVTVQYQLRRRAKPWEIMLHINSKVIISSIQW